MANGEIVSETLLGEKLRKEECEDCGWKDEASMKAAQVKELQAENREIGRTVDQLTAELRSKMSKESLSGLLVKVERDKSVKHLQNVIEDLHAEIVIIKSRNSEMHSQLEFYKRNLEDFKNEEELNSDLKAFKKGVIIAEAEKRRVDRELTQKRVELEQVNANLLALKRDFNSRLDCRNAMNTELVELRKELKAKRYDLIKQKRGGLTAFLSRIFRKKNKGGRYDKK